MTILSLLFKAFAEVLADVFIQLLSRPDATKLPDAPTFLKESPAPTTVNDAIDKYAGVSY